MATQITVAASVAPGAAAAATVRPAACPGRPGPGVSAAR